MDVILFAIHSYSVFFILISVKKYISCQFNTNLTPIWVGGQGAGRQTRQGGDGQKSNAGPVYDSEPPALPPWGAPSFGSTGDVQRLLIHRECHWPAVSAIRVNQSASLACGVGHNSRLERRLHWPAHPRRWAQLQSQTREWPVVFGSKKIIWGWDNDDFD